MFCSTNTPKYSVYKYKQQIPLFEKLEVENVDHFVTIFALKNRGNN